MSCKYKYCGSNTNVNSFEDFIKEALGFYNKFNFEEVKEECCNKSKCNTCCRNESLRYCGEDYPEVGVYKGDHYDDVIEAVLNYVKSIIDE